MRFMPRLGLLGATLALPVGAALANHVLAKDPVPAGPAEVRIGESHDRPGGRVGQPSTPPSPVAVRPAVVGESSTAARPPVQPAESTTPRPTSEGIVPPAPPVVDDGGAAAKGKAKGKSSSHPTPPTSRGANGSGG